MVTLARNHNLPTTTDQALPPEVEAQAHQARIQAVEAAAKAVPRVLQTLITRAEEGDPAAARLILEVAGVVRRGAGVTVAVQNVVPPRYKPDDILEEWEDASPVDRKGGPTRGDVIDV